MRRDEFAQQLELRGIRVLEFIDDDELVEVTPLSIRLRKKELDPTKRNRSNRS